MPEQAAQPTRVCACGCGTQFTPPPRPMPNALKSQVPGVGVEPTHPCGWRIL